MKSGINSACYANTHINGKTMQMKFIVQHQKGIVRTKKKLRMQRGKNMRLIDADALLDRIRNPYEQAQVARWVNEQPTINQWIPCSERLPDEDYWTGANFQYSADVLMTVYNAEDEETILDYGHTVDGSWYSDTTDCLVPPCWEVLAWMPLPECYRGDENVK